MGLSKGFNTLIRQGFATFPTRKHPFKLKNDVTDIVSRRNNKCTAKYQRERRKRLHEHSAQDLTNWASTTSRPLPQRSSSPSTDLTFGTPSTDLTLGTLPTFQSKFMRLDVDEAAGGSNNYCDLVEALGIFSEGMDLEEGHSFSNDGAMTDTYSDDDQQHIQQNTKDLDILAKADKRNKDMANWGVMQETDYASSDNDSDNESTLTERASTMSRETSEVCHQVEVRLGLTKADLRSEDAAVVRVDVTLETTLFWLRETIHEKIKCCLGRLRVEGLDITAGFEGNQTPIYLVQVKKVSPRSRKLKTTLLPIDNDEDLRNAVSGHANGEDLGNFGAVISNENHNNELDASLGSSGPGVGTDTTQNGATIVAVKIHVSICHKNKYSRKGSKGGLVEITTEEVRLDSRTEDIGVDANTDLFLREVSNFLRSSKRHIVSGDMVAFLNINDDGSFKGRNGKAFSMVKSLKNVTWLEKEHASGVLRVTRVGVQVSRTPHDPKFQLGSGDGMGGSGLHLRPNEMNQAIVTDEDDHNEMKGRLFTIVTDSMERAGYVYDQQTAYVIVNKIMQRREPGGERDQVLQDGVVKKWPKLIGPRKLRKKNEGVEKTTTSTSGSNAASHTPPNTGVVAQGNSDHITQMQQMLMLQQMAQMAQNIGGQSAVAPLLSPISNAQGCFRIVTPSPMQEPPVIEGEKSSPSLDSTARLTILKNQLDMGLLSAEAYARGQDAVAELVAKGELF